VKPKSAQEKGKRFEKFVIEQMEQEGLGKSVRTPGSGSGKIKGDIFNNLDFMFECKNQKKLNWLQSIDQAKNQAVIGNFSSQKWALIVKDARTPETDPEVYAIVDLWQFLQLLKKNQEPKIKAPDREMKWKLTNLKNAIKQVDKYLK